MPNKNGLKSKTLKPILQVSARALLILVMLLLCGYSVHYASQSPYFQAREIHYQGVVHVDRETLDGLIRSAFSGNILRMDLERLRSLVESEPWVKSAIVRRKLPDEIFIYITEREVAALAAIDGELYLVDAEGRVLDRHGPRYPSLDKPIVKGLKNVARENAREENAARMEVYLRVLGELNSPRQDYSEQISEVNVEDLDRVAVIPADEPVPVYLGNHKFLRRYQIFLSKKDLYRQLKEQYGSIESVDVSYENKIIFHTPRHPGGTVISQGRSENKHGKEEVALGRN